MPNHNPTRTRKQLKALGTPAPLALVNLRGTDLTELEEGRRKLVLHEATRVVAIIRYVCRCIVRFGLF